jgi:hypothetical protein
MGRFNKRGAAVLGVMCQVYGRTPETFGDSRITKVGLGGTAHTRKLF